MSKLPPCSHANAGGPLCCLVCLRAALAAASDKLIEWEAALAAAEAKLADERRHVVDLVLALEETRCTCEAVFIGGRPTALKCVKCRTLEAHAARRAAEVAPKPATARRADAGPFGKWEIEPALSVEHDLQYTNDDNEAFDIATRVLERLWDDMEPGDTRTLRITLNAEVDRG